MHWYYHNGQQSVGPLTEQEFQSLVASGTIKEATLVWNETMPNWQRLDELQKGFPPPPPPQPVAPELDAPPLHYAGFWARGAAKIVDYLILSFLMAIWLVPMILKSSADAPPDFESFYSMQFQLIGLLIQGLYTIFFIGQFEATPGKMLLGLKVVRANGERVGWGLSTGRFGGEILSMVLCHLGYLLAVFDSEKRTLHDHLCSTRVIHK
jgi:uncharacterized RDD family membrane protein YckC